MIIKATRIRANSGPHGLTAHVFRGTENERIEVLRGSEAHVAEMFKDAIWSGHLYAVRHFVISPAHYSRDVLASATQKLAEEFGFDRRDAVMIKHSKPRADGSETADRHVHMLVSEATMAGGVLSSSHMYARHEKIARLVEMETGEALTKGRHNRAVYQALIQSGKTEEAAEMRALTAGPPAMSAYSTGQFQRAKRLGYDLADLRQHLKDTDEQGLSTILSARGLSCVPGPGKGKVLITAEGQVIASLDRLCPFQFNLKEITSNNEEYSDDKNSKTSKIKEQIVEPESIEGPASEQIRDARADQAAQTSTGAAQTDSIPTDATQADGAPTGASQTEETLGQPTSARNSTDGIQQVVPGKATRGHSGDYNHQERGARDSERPENTGGRSQHGSVGRGYLVDPDGVERDTGKPDRSHKNSYAGGENASGSFPRGGEDKTDQPALMRKPQARIIEDAGQMEGQKLRPLVRSRGYTPILRLRRRLSAQHVDPASKAKLRSLLQAVPVGDAPQTNPVSDVPDADTIPENTVVMREPSSAPNTPFSTAPETEPEDRPSPFPVSPKQQDRPVSAPSDDPEIDIQRYLLGNIDMDQFHEDLKKVQRAPPRDLSDPGHRNR